MCDHDCLNCKYEECICDDDFLEEECESRDGEIIRDRMCRTIRTERLLYDERSTSDYRGRGKIEIPEDIVQAKRHEYYIAHREERIAYQREYDRQNSKQSYQRHKEKKKKSSIAYYHERMKDPAFREKERQRARERYRRKKNERTNDIV